MDLSLQTQSSSPTKSQARDLVSLSHSPTEKVLSAYETGTETMSDPSDPADKSTETLTNTSICLSHEKNTHSAHLKLSSSSYNVSDCLSLCLETVPMDSDPRVCADYGSTDPLHPLSPPSCDLMKPFSEILSEININQEPTLSFCLMHDNTTPETFGATSSTSEGLTGLCTNNPLRRLDFSSEHSHAIYPMSTSTPPSHSSESDTAIATVPELYIYESERQNSILDPNVDLQEIKCPDFQSKSQREELQTCHYYETRVIVCDSADVLIKTHHSSSQGQAVVDYESDMAQRVELKPPAADASEESLTSVNDNKLRKVEVSAVTHQARQNDSPVELWLDACQYLAGEENMDVLERTSLSVMQEGLSVIRDSSILPGETQESGYSPDGSEGIGWSCEDIRGPPVERWSSVDSWATALSDWTGIITEDITPAFTEIGVEIDALTQALAEVTDTDKETSRGRQIPAQPPMGIQDHPQEALSIPESSILSGETSHPLCLPAVGPELQNRVGFQSPESLCVFNGYVDSLETDIFVNNKDPVILNIIEDSDFEGKNSPIEIITGEPSAGGLCGVTNEHSPCSAVQQEPRSSCETTKVDSEETESSSDPHLFTTNTLTNSHVSDVDTQSGLHLDIDTNVLLVTLPNADGTCQVEPQWGSSKFIMPVVPLRPSSSLMCQTGSSLEGDHICVKTSLNDNRAPSCGHLQPCVLWPTLDGITDIATTDGYKEQTHKKEKRMDSAEKCLPKGQLDLKTGNTSECFLTEGKTISEEINNLSREFSNLAVVPADNFVIPEKNRVAIITLELSDPPLSSPEKPITAVQPDNPVRCQRKVKKMPHKSHKHASESKTRSKKDKSAGHHHGAQASQMQETLSHHATGQQTCRQPEINFPLRENLSSVNASAEREENPNKLEIGVNVASKKVASKPHGKKKKKTGQNTAALRNIGEPQADEENGAKPNASTTKGRINMFEAKFDGKSERAKKESGFSNVAEKKSQHLQPNDSQEELPAHHEERKDHQPKNCCGPLKKDVTKRQRLSGDKFGKLVSVLESKLPKPDVCIKTKTDERKADTETTHKKAYSEVVKQKIPPKEDPKVVQPIQAVSVSLDPQSLCLCCQFASVSDYTVTWSREDTLLTEIKRSAEDESKVSLTISNASRKDLGKYQCRLSSLHGSVTLDYLLTYEVLNEIVVLPSTKTITSASVTVGSEEEDAHCSRLMFKEDFLSDQYFGDNHPVSIVTEKVHFGEGMHRRAFRTKLQAGQVPCLQPGHSCVLKVHNVITCGTKNNDELVKKNFTLAVEECQVQNTAREYIKAYTAAAQSVDDFGDVPEIIPIYLVHRPSSDIPYATLEEELIGDFVKYSVKDGKEINLLRCDSEAGQKCCAFQHWVYHKTEGNLLVTDMQGVGMRLTDVGIATCRKGYKGFKGNCSTSFIDQFKALHQCNTYCKILGLTSLQPKARQPMSAPKPKLQPPAAPKKKTFGPTVKGKP